MFDLHMHTTLSDGALTVEELLQRLKEKEIKLFSITDHNHALAYDHITDDSLNIIKGTEITTSYNGTIIEILGYNIEPSVINEWYMNFYSDENMQLNELKLFEELVSLSNQLGYSIDSNLKMKEIIKGESKKTVFYHLAETLDNFEFKTYKEFFRKGLSNPESQWFIDEGRYYPSIQEVIDLIHKAEGVAILAHPYEYGFDSFDTLFESLIEAGVDGIECFHPSCAMINSVNLVKYCMDHKLLASGGSDFHRDSRYINHGVNAHDDLLSYECFDWIREKLI